VDWAAALDWSAAGEEFRRREFTILRDTAVAIPHANAEIFADLFDPAVPDAIWHADVDPKLRQALAASATVPGGLPTFAAYIYGLCQKRWAHSTDHPTILRMAEASADCYARHRTALAGPARALAGPAGAKVEKLYERVAALKARLEDREQHIYRLVVDIAASVLAAASLADLFQLVNNAFADWRLFGEVGFVLASA
jgi:hypothetical protein